MQARRLSAHSSAAGRADKKKGRRRERKRQRSRPRLSPVCVVSHVRDTTSGLHCRSCRQICEYHAGRTTGLTSAKGARRDCVGTVLYSVYWACEVRQCCSKMPARRLPQATLWGDVVGLVPPRARVIGMCDLVDGRQKQVESPFRWPRAMEPCDASSRRRGGLLNTGGRVRGSNVVQDILWQWTVGVGTGLSNPGGGGGAGRLCKYEGSLGRRGGSACLRSAWGGVQVLLCRWPSEVGGSHVIMAKSATATAI